jgi:hypothetical protein
MDFSRELVAFAVSRRGYSIKEQAHLKEPAFGYSVKANVQNISKQTQSFFVESRHYDRQWKGATADVTPAPWPYITDKGLIRVDLKPGEVHTMEFPLVLSDRIKPRLKRGSIAHEEQMFRLEFTPEYSRVVSGKKEEVRNLGRFRTPEFGVIVEE